jgi:hypothetical protein
MAWAFLLLALACARRVDHYNVLDVKAPYGAYSPYSPPVYGESNGVPPPPNGESGGVPPPPNGESSGTQIPQVLPPDNIDGYVKLSLPCSDPLSNKFGDAKLYTIYAFSGGIYVSGTSSPTAFTTNAAGATQFFVVPVNAAGCTSRLLQYNQEFYLVTPDGKYLERYQRITTETPSDQPHQSARFNLGLASTPSQTWKVEYPQGQTGPVPSSLSAKVGLSIGGTGSDWTKPDNNIRRVLTLRDSDGASIVVQWWAVNEELALPPAASQNIPAGWSCSVSPPQPPPPKENTYTPSENSYAPPPPNGYTPSESSYVPPPPNGYTPSESSYGESSYVPPPNGYTPSESSYGESSYVPPPPNSYAPSEGGYVPPPPSGYTPSENTYTPKENTYVPPPPPPPPASYTPKKY